MIPIGNFVEIEVEKGTKMVKVGDEEFYIDNSYDPGNHVTTTGVIKSIPTKLIYKGEKGMEWKTSIDIQVGDKVWFQKYEAIQSLGRLADPVLSDFEDNSSYIIVNDRIHIFIPYSALFCVERNNEIIMLNGYVIIEPIEKKYNTIFDIPAKMKVDEATMGKILLMGKPNEEYDFKDYVDTMGYEVGDTVLFRKNNNTPHMDLFNRKVYKVQRKSVLTKI